MKNFRFSLSKYGSLFLWYCPFLVVQCISAYVTFKSLNPWYLELKKAFWNPPSWVFGPVWTILYIMITFSIWLVYLSKKGGALKKAAFFLFWLQLGSNFLWSLLFFGFQSPFYALIDLSILLILIFLMTIVFFRIKRLSGCLLIPYLGWCLYAYTLNMAIVIMN